METTCGQMSPPKMETTCNALAWQRSLKILLKQIESSGFFSAIAIGAVPVYYFVNRTWSHWAGNWSRGYWGPARSAHGQRGAPWPQPGHWTPAAQCFGSSLLQRSAALGYFTRHTAPAPHGQYFKHTARVHDYWPGHRLSVALYLLISTFKLSRYSVSDAISDMLRITEILNSMPI